MKGMWILMAIVALGVSAGGTEPARAAARQTRRAPNKILNFHFKLKRALTDIEFARVLGYADWTLNLIARAPTVAKTVSCGLRGDFNMLSTIYQHLVTAISAGRRIQVGCGGTNQGTFTRVDLNNPTHKFVLQVK